MTGLTPEDLAQPITENMRNDFSVLRVDQTVGQALETIRRQATLGRIIYFYVVDAGNRLVGVIPTRRLLMSELDTPLDKVMIDNVIAIPHTATVLDACEFFVFHRLLAFPVVDEQRRVIGVVDVELYTKELSELERVERGDELFQLIGVHLAVSQQSSPFGAFSARFPWLLCNIAGGIAAAFLSGFFENELQQVVALALFIPVVLALSESVAIQSVSLALQILRGQQPTWQVVVGRLKRELFIGWLLGAACALFVAGVALAWLWDGRVAVCLLVGISAGVTLSAILGVAIPNLLHLLKRDPQVAAGPVALASADMITLLAYFNLARWLFA